MKAATYRSRFFVCITKTAHILDGNKSTSKPCALSLSHLWCQLPLGGSQRKPSPAGEGGPLAVDEELASHSSDKPRENLML